jgi:hypothetical protein
VRLSKETGAAKQDYSALILLRFSVPAICFCVALLGGAIGAREYLTGAEFASCFLPGVPCHREYDRPAPVRRSKGDEKTSSMSTTRAEVVRGLNHQQKVHEDDGQHGWPKQVEDHR